MLKFEEYLKQAFLSVEQNLNKDDEFMNALNDVCKYNLEHINLDEIIKENQKLEFDKYDIEYHDDEDETDTESLLTTYRDNFNPDRKFEYQIYVPNIKTDIRIIRYLTANLLLNYACIYDTEMLVKAISSTRYTKIKSFYKEFSKYYEYTLLTSLYEINKETLEYINDSNKQHFDELRTIIKETDKIRLVLKLFTCLNLQQYFI